MSFVHLTLFILHITCSIVIHERMVNLLRIGICDDQFEFSNTLRNLLQSYLSKNNTDAQIVIFTNTYELFQYNWYTFQILFLDVVMPNQDGIEAAMQIRKQNPDISIIFVSQFLDYATMGYQVKASAYLLKNQLNTVLINVMDSVLLEQKLHQEFLDIVIGGYTVPIPLQEISYIESQGRTVIFYGQKEYRSYLRFSDVESTLSGKGFLRIHRCYIINMAHCVTIKNYTAILDNGQTLPCTRQDYRNLLHSLIRWKGNN